MFFTMFKLPEESIYIVRIEFPLDQSLSGARFIWNKLNVLAAGQDDPVFGIVDIGVEPMGVSDILLWIDERRSNPECMLRHPNLHILAVGDNPLLMVARKRLLKILGSSIEVFKTLDEAIETARHQQVLYSRSS